jgi:hypothetical protein
MIKVDAMTRAAAMALENSLDSTTRQRIDLAVERMVQTKENGGQIVVVTGSGPNLHEGVTTLVADMIRCGLVDGVTTSSAVVAHEMAGVLERVKRVDGWELGIDRSLLPYGGTFELSLLNDAVLEEIAAGMPIDRNLFERLRQAPGDVIIKAAGNLSYPLGLWIERLSTDILTLARTAGTTFEEVAGWGADQRTMIGQAARQRKPALVTIPQLVGGGAVGLAIGDSISITDRSARLARMLTDADVIIESAVALTQEIHDGPFETHTGHGLWAAWQGLPTFSLEGKTLIRIDLDPALEKVWQLERDRGAVQELIRTGAPKAKTFGVPFRMEMSGFARLEGSIPLSGDIGAIWPVLACRLADSLGVQLDFLSFPQHSPQGLAVREHIVESIRPYRHRNAQQQVAQRMSAQRAAQPAAPL